MTSSLKTKALSGVVWSFVQRFGSMAISFVSNIVLARLLTPDDYGVIGMLMIFIAVANTFVDGGFGSALIQKKEPTNDDYSTIFWWNMFLSLIIYGVLYVSAPIIAQFYNLHILSDVLRVQGIILFINALGVVQQNQLRKQLRFKQLASITVISAILSACIAIYLAWNSWGVWSLVAQQLLLSFFTTILLWGLNRWWPSIVFSRKSFKQLFGFGGFILISNLINTICSNIQGLLIGKFFTPAILGYYSQARKLEDITSTSLSTVIDQVSYPILSMYQHNLRDLTIILKKLISIIAFVSIVLMGMLVTLAHPIILFLYTDKWLPSVPYLQILCMAGIAISLQKIHYSAIASIGKSKDLFIWTFIKRAAGLLIIIISMLLWGIKGLLWGCVANSWIILIVNAYLTSKHLGYKLLQQLIDVLPIIIISLISYFIPLIFLNVLNFDIILKSIAHCLFFVITYVILSIIFRINAYMQLKNIFKEYISEKYYNNRKQNIVVES